MSGENRYISPIIDAFLKRREQDLTNQRAAEQNQRLIQQAQNEQKYRDALIKESESRIQAERDNHEATAKLTEQLRQISADKAQQDVQQHIRDIYQNAGPEPGAPQKAVANFIRGVGGQVNPAGSNPLTVGGQQLPGSPTETYQTKNPVTGEMSQPFNTEGMANAQQLIERAANKAGAVTGANKAAIEPYTAMDYERKHAGDTDLANSRIQAQIQRDAANNRSKEKIADNRNSTELSMNAVNAGTRMNVARMIQFGTPEDTAAGGAALYDDFLTGRSNFQGAKAPDQKLASSYARANGLAMPFEAKDYQGRVQLAAQVQGFLNDREKWAQQYSAGKSSEILPQMRSPGSVGSYVAGTSNLENDKDALLKDSGKFQKQFEGFGGSGRSFAMLQQGSKGTGLDPNASYEQNHRNIEQSRADMTRDVRSLFAGQNDDTINHVLGTNGATNFVVPGETERSGNPDVPGARIPHPNNPQAPPIPLKNPKGQYPWPNASKMAGRPVYGSTVEPQNWQSYSSHFMPQAPGASQGANAVPTTNPQGVQ